MPWTPNSVASWGSASTSIFTKRARGFELLGGCRKDRGHDAAGTAPGRPEVRHHGNVVPSQVLLKACTTQSNGLTLEELDTALATLG
jgi:hypothetical protein